MAYTQTQFEESMRLTLQPGHLAAQLPEIEAPIVTGVALADTEYVIKGTDQLSLEEATDFTYDVGNDWFYFSRSGAVDVPFRLSASISFAQTIGTPDAELTIRATKNGTALEGIYIKRTIRTSNTVGVGAINGHFTLSENDRIELTVESEKTGDFNTWAFATDIMEEAK